MKSIILVISTFMTLNAFAGKTPTCANQAVYAAVEKNYKTFEAGTNSCGIKALHIGETLETYLVCTSDETDPMEYVVTVQPTKYNDGKPNELCAVSYVEVSYDSETPDFDSDEGLIANTQNCKIDYGDDKVICK
jgi:hypothetical protein